MVAQALDQPFGKPDAGSNTADNEYFSLQMTINTFDESTQWRNATNVTLHSLRHAI